MKSMPNKYSYKISEQANSELDEIMAYISNELHAQESAIALLGDMVDAIEAACEYPQSYPLINDPLLSARGYRKIVVKNYLVIYVLEEAEKVLYIAHIVYGGQNYMKYI